MIEFFDHMSFTPLTLVHLILALGVTCHVLLNKRAPSASIGWIGLTWLAPIIGTVGYVLLGINRVKRRASRLRGGLPDRMTTSSNPRLGRREDHLSALEATVSRITDRPLEEGNAVAIMHNGDEAYPLMLAAIDDAKISVAMSSYIFHADAAGGDFIDALSRANDRGCTVRVIIDGIGGGYVGSKAYHALVASGVRAERFLHSYLPWRMPFLNLRLHKKILVLDGRVAFSGGLNIGDENVLAKNPSIKVRDTQFRFDGPIVSQLMETFAKDWLFVADEELSGDRWFPPQEEQGRAIARVVNSGPDQDVEKIEFVKFQAATCARRSIGILTPYFLPDERLETALAMAAMRGVAVDVILPARSDHRVMDWAMGEQIGPLIAAGCRFWSNPEPFEHSKITVVDGEWALVGSANWDMRSLRLNFETDVEIYERAFARQIEALLSLRMIEPLNCEKVNGRSLPVRLRDSATRLLLPYL